MLRSEFKSAEKMIMEVGIKIALQTADLIERTLFLRENSA